jgi:hypothetical protein
VAEDKDKSLLGKIMELKKTDVKSGNTFKFEKPDDVIAGVILEIKSGTKYGDDKLMLKARSDVDGKVYAVFPPTMGISQLLQRGARVGDHMAQRFIDWEKNEGGQPYKFMVTLIERDGVLIEPGDDNGGESGGNGGNDNSGQVADDDIPI